MCLYAHGPLWLYALIKYRIVSYRIKTQYVTCLKRPLNKKTKQCFSRQIIAYCRSEVSQNFPLGAFVALSLGTVRYLWLRILTVVHILQYFWPSLTHHLSIRYLFCLFLSGRLRQVLLYSVLALNCKTAERWLWSWFKPFDTLILKTSQQTTSRRFTQHTYKESNKTQSWYFYLELYQFSTCTCYCSYGSILYRPNTYSFHFVLSAAKSNESYRCYCVNSWCVCSK